MQKYRAVVVQRNPTTGSITVLSSWITDWKDSLSEVVEAAEKAVQTGAHNEVAVISDIGVVKVKSQTTTELYTK